MTSRAYIVDKIHLIGELLALADHLEEKFIASEDKDERARLQEAIEKVLATRREIMASLMGDGESPDPTFACAFKHACKTFTLESEVYESTHSEEDLERLRNTADILAMATSLYLGIGEFKNCWRCLSEVMLEKQLTKKQV